METSDHKQIIIQNSTDSMTFHTQSPHLVLNAFEVALTNTSEYCFLPECGFYQAGESHPLHLIQSQAHAYR